MKWKFWIDRGGTFTDLVGINPFGKQIVRKVLSVQPNHFGDPAVRAIKEVLRLREDDPIPKGLIQEVRLGTTVATNTLLEDVGSPVILFCNRGLGDLLRIGDQRRPDLFALNIERSKFLANAVLEVEGRIDTNGKELQPLLISKELEEEVRTKHLQGNKTCAIVLLNSYANPDHELKLKKWLIQIGFQNVICSHKISPLPRVVARGQTTLVEAKISPVFLAYLRQIRNDLGISTRIRIMGSSGTLFPPDVLLAKDTILSGPAGGMVGAVAAAKESGLNKQPLIGFDMGGTSTDVFYVPAGQGNHWKRLPETEIAGQQLMAQRLPIHTVAAGGGSIIYEQGGLLKVGPRSANAIPGPACYRRGGPLTITDANLLLGRLQSTTFPALFGPSGNQTIDKSIVQKLFSEIAETFNSTPEKIAEGALIIALERMADAIKQVSVFCGHDIRKGVLVAFGGAGGQHACRLAQLLGLEKVLFHPLAGVLSAYGIGIAPQSQFRTTNLREPLNKATVEKLKKLCDSEKKKATELLEDCEEDQIETDSITSIQLARVEIRYQSCEQGLVVNLEDKDNTISLIEKFESAHHERFSYIPPRNEPLILERLEIEVITPTPQENRRVVHNVAPLQNPRNTVQVYFSHLGWVNVPLYQRESLPLGQLLEGPALIVDSTSSIVLEAGWTASIEGHGSLLLHVNKAKKKIFKRLNNSNIYKPDPVTLELFHHRFSSIAKKMGQRLKQTSRSINIRERMDFSCAVFDQDGALVANAPHIPVHLGSMGESIVDLLRQISNGTREPLRALETVLSNDPFHGGTHLPDITAITPVFAGAKTPRYFVASRGHHADVGGLTPGSMPPFSKSIVDEGLLIRNETFAVNGEHNRVFWEKRLGQGKIPPRNPEELIADLQAQVAANHLGVIEIEKLVSNFGHKEVSAYMSHLQSNAMKAVQNLIKNLTNSSYSVELDNGARLSVEITIDQTNSKATLDFSNTSFQGEGNFQAPLAVTKSVVLYVFRCLIEEDLPLNAGCFTPLELIVPKGCLLNPSAPSAVVAGNVETSQALCNLLFGALGVLSASQGTMNNLTFGNKHQQYYETLGGGSGAGNGFNGTDGIQTHMTNSRLTDPEILERRFPVQLEMFAIRKESGGKGQWNGGNGLLRKFRFLKPMTVSILSGSRRIAPFGLNGGMPGEVGLNQLEKINGEKTIIEGCACLQVSAGESIIIATPGGGGYGKPLNSHTLSTKPTKI
ncbi:hydantoinase B/oxoprolinase family protein [Prochlorococcus sp. MIT 1307]|uniref:hydantoinase B/oxoprolinase family protein n=1 Tax=Prochlorococcus sp. MIT 1307 TaxID=3096219 RepID=UPI002A7539E1|nr:hydantoinase B/oxoprolinase family protein [Prochlorococcus sp. MIT 1307]